MEEREPVLYESRPGARGLWQRYRILADRVELEFHGLGTVRVPFEAIERAVVRPPLVICDLFRGAYASAS